MMGDVDLGQKSRGSVTTITKRFTEDCDVCHGKACDAAQPGRKPKPTIQGMSQAGSTLQSKESRETEKSSDGASPKSESSLDSSLSGFRPRPLQVTWEMNAACDWKAASARASRAPR